MDKIVLFLQGDGEWEKMQEFTKHYGLQKSFEAVGLDTDVYVAKHERVCRYCGLIGSQTKWNDAHIVPDFLGNHNRFAMDECKVCNQKFSKYETALCSFLGMSRTLNNVKGKNKVPNFKSLDQSIVARPTEFKNKSVIKVSKEGAGVDDVSIDIEKKQVIINYTKERYVPLNVAKAFTKIGFALLPKEELEYYSFTKVFLLGDKNNPAPTGSFYLRGYSIPFNSGVPFPIVWIFKKKDPEAKIPMHMCVLWWQNFLFQFYIPLHSKDLKRIATEDFVIPKVPMLFFQETNGSIPITPFFYDFSSNEISDEGEKASVVINMEKGFTDESLLLLQESIRQGYFEIFMENVPRNNEGID